MVHVCISLLFMTLLTTNEAYNLRSTKQIIQVHKESTLLSAKQREAMEATYSYNPPKRHAMEDCGEAVKKAREQHAFGILAGKFLAGLQTEGRKYEEAKKISIKVQGLCIEKIAESKRLVEKYAARIARATPGDKVKDPLSGISEVDKWDDAHENEQAEVKFYNTLLSNAREVGGLTNKGLTQVKRLKSGVHDMQKSRKQLTALIDDADKVKNDARSLWKQWQDSSKAYSCGTPPGVDHASSQCNEGNTKFSRRCDVTCLPGYDGEGTQNALRCSREGTFGMELYGEWIGMAACVGRVCGKPPKIGKAKTVIQDIRYPHSASYACYEGFSTTGNASGAKAFNVPCGSTGFFEQNASHECKAISCGAATPMKSTHPVQGVFKYTEFATYKCRHGFTVDGTHDGLTSFSTSCQGTGEFTQGLGCKPIRCGPAPAYENTVINSPTNAEQFFGNVLSFHCSAGNTLNQKGDGPEHFTLVCGADGEYALEGTDGTTPLPTCRPVSAGLAPEIPHGNFNRKEMFYGESVLVTAETGYSTLGEPADGLSFLLKVSPNGKYVGQETFVPVVCGGLPAVEKATSSFVGGRATYGNLLSYECEQGYSTDKTAARPSASFSIQCEADGSFSAVPGLGKCANIDDCADHTCGPHGSCVDHVMNYTCECQAGYQQRWDNKTNELICGNVDDCGPQACGVGDCIDLIDGYKCQCPVGYQEVNEEGDDGSLEHTCQAVMCGVPYELRHAATTPVEVGSEKAYYNNNIVYQCHAGYTLSGMSTGKNHVSMQCLASKKFSLDKEAADGLCKPIQCRNVPKVDNAAPKGTALQLKSITFNQSVRYSCATGHTVDGSASGDHGFTVKCQITGELGETQACKPVSCGEPDEIPNAFRPSGSLLFDESVSYKCFDGFTLDGSEKGSTEFHVSCRATGRLTKAKQCLPKICGEPPQQIDVLYASTKDEGKVTYPMITEVMCRDGYTVGGDPGGNATFLVRCLSSGVFEQVDKRECEPVRCGAAPPMANATLLKIQSPKPGKQGNFLNYEEKALYQCAEGFTTGGELDAPTTFHVECLPSSQFSAPAPDMQCRNVNDCEQHTCGPKGQCIDLVGPSPAYTCKCEDGYEIQTSSNGEKRCGNKDDCQGRDCGVGVCKDLVGDYTCQCPSGHYVGVKDGAKTCIPVSCADEAASIANGRMLSRHSGPVNFPETLRYKCDTGYSVDATVSESKREFQSQCKANGQLIGMMSCRKVSCGTPHVLPFTKLLTPGSPRKSVEYNEKARYECSNGYTVGGHPGAKITFEVKCLDNGVLTDPEVCEPVKCGIAPRVPKSRPGVAGQVFFGQQLTYKCDMGYTLDSSPQGKTEFVRDCHKDGHFSALPTAAPCNPISAGNAPTIRNADMTEYDGKSVSAFPPRVSYPNGLEYRCKPGYSTSGHPSGPTKITAKVNSIGTFTPALPTECQLIVFTVRGRVKDARNGEALHGVKVTVEGSSDIVTSTLGFFSFGDIRAGTVKLVYEKEGWITTSKEITIIGDVNSGGVADIAMSPAMANDEWRAVVKWDRSPADLDTYGQWGWSKTSWSARRVSSVGMTGVLEVDEVNGYGPETLYLRGVGDCSGGSYYCDIKYSINDYNEEGTMKRDSKAEVTLYNGNRMAGMWKIEECPHGMSDDGNWWHVFTIDGATNDLKWSCNQAPVLIQGPGLDNTVVTGDSTAQDAPAVAKPRLRVRRMPA